MKNNIGSSANVELKKNVKLGILFFTLLVLLILVSLLSLSLGSAKITLNKIIEILFQNGQGIEARIIFELRLPRIILGLAIGGALSLSGAILQGLFRNSLVEPYTLGISGGSGVLVGLTLIFQLDRFIGFFSLPLAGFIGALLIIIIIYLLSIKQGIFQMNELLLKGVMISFISSSFMMLIMSLTKTENLHSIVYWIMGSLDETHKGLIGTVAAVSVLGLIIASFFSLNLNAMSVGEEEALYLGINVEQTKHILFVLTSLLTGVCVGVGGIIGFVGLVVPHFIRQLIGNDYRFLLIGSFMAGAVFLIFCDLIARMVIAPIELPVGVITGLLGGIIFILVLNKRRLKI
jgi:iron complex transport system permease protein